MHVHVIAIRYLNQDKKHTAVKLPSDAALLGSVSIIKLLFLQLYPLSRYSVMHYCPTLVETQKPSNSAEIWNVDQTGFKQANSFSQVIKTILFRGRTES